MADRDIEEIRDRAEFIATLRRVADALERNELIHIQLASKRFIIPRSAQLSLEHEVEGDDAELELQFRWQLSSIAKELG